MDFKTFSKLIMIEQTLFALPFALVGVLFAGGGAFSDWVLVIIALAAARTAGMSFNRVIDAEIDAKNPRTKDRLIPIGDVSPLAVWLTGIISSLLLILASLMLNRLCFYLSFPAVAMLLTYSYFKRFSSSSHFYLGFVEAAAPIGGYLAVTGKFDMISVILGIVIMAWIAGLDIVYSLQDMDFDKKEGLFSVPARYGKEKALTVSAVCYGLSICGLLLAGILTVKGGVYWISVFCISGIFGFQQLLARKENIADSMKLFFKINMLVSPILFFGTLIDVFIA